MFLHSWNDGAPKQKIIDFVNKVTDPLSPSFVSKKERIAVFDNDGTLHPQKPLLQTTFIQARVAQMVKDNPELMKIPAYKLFAKRNPNYRSLISNEELHDLYLSVQSGMTQKAYKQAVDKFLEEELHPDFQRPYTHLAYQPMLELIDFLKAKKFRVYINTAGGTDFVRVFAEKVYKIQPNKVIGTPMQLQIQDDGEFKRLKAYAWPTNNRESKMVHFEHIVGRPPILAVGDSDGDIELLSYAKAGSKGLAILLKHDDPIREYEDDSHAQAALKTAQEKDWTIVSMQNDFKTVFLDSLFPLKA